MVADQHNFDGRLTGYVGHVTPATTASMAFETQSTNYINTEASYIPLQSVRTGTTPCLRCPSIIHDRRLANRLVMDLD